MDSFWEDILKTVVAALAVKIIADIVIPPRQQSFVFVACYCENC
ncbi:MAG: hypothetical protein WAJ93_20155 [Candidatus Nitrosopolaris sp.]